MEFLNTGQGERDHTVRLHQGERRVLTAVARIFYETVSADYRRRSGLASPRTGAVTPGSGGLFRLPTP
jgi:hypothetical protein